MVAKRPESHLLEPSTRTRNTFYSTTRSQRSTRTLQSTSPTSVCVDLCSKAVQWCVSSFSYITLEYSRFKD